MVLHADAPRMVAMPHLFDDAVVDTPRFHFQAVSQAIDGLMVTAVDVRKNSRSRDPSLVAQSLDFVIALLRPIVSFDMQLQRSTQSYV